MHTNDKRFCRESSPFKRCGTALWADFGGNHLRRSTHKHIITYRFYHKEAMKIKDLPPVTVRELCRYLNIEGDGQRNWKELVSRIPGIVNKQLVKWLCFTEFVVQAAIIPTIIT